MPQPHLHLMQGNMRYLFGTYVLDTVQRELRCAGAPIKLERKIYQALLYLVQHHDRLVTREELLAHLWPQTYVAEAAVTRCIRAVRRAVGDRPDRQQVIQTRHGHGYRFVAPVVEEPETPAAPAPSLPGADRWPEPAPGLPLPVRPVVGRQAEVERLRQHIRRALGGERQLVFISADAGVGKTTLVEMLLLEMAGEPGVSLGRGQCVEYYGEGEPYLPVLEALGQLCRAPGGERLRQVLRQYAPTWLVQLPGLVAEAEMERLQQQTQGNTRGRMLRELAEAIEVLTGRTAPGVPPFLVLVLEDLHWSDPSTVALLAYCARRREPARLLVLGTYRPIAHAPEAHPLRGMVQELLGHGLGADLSGAAQCRGKAAYATARLGGQVAPALAAFIQAHTEGNALFMVHILEDLVQRGLLRQEAGQWTVLPRYMRTAPALPNALRQLLTRQFERCPSEARRLLEAASVVGVRFVTAAVAAGLQQAPDEVESLCEVLAHQGNFLEALELTVWPDGTYSGQYQFRHVLYRQVVYERLSPARRMHLHRRIGERLEAGYGAQAQALATDLALHFASAQELQRAAQYRLYAAANARHRQALAEAADHLTAGLTLLATLPTTPERTRLTLVMQTFLAQVLLVTRGVAHPDTQSALAQVRHRALQGSDTAERFDALSLLARMMQLQTSTDTTAARALAEQCLSLAQRLRLPHCEARARFLLGTLLYERGEFAEAYEHCAQGITLEGSCQSEYGWSPTPYHPEVGCLDSGALAL